MSIDLGNILHEMNCLAVQHPSVLKSDVRDIPQGDIQFYLQYDHLKRKLNEFGRRIDSYVSRGRE